MQTPQVICLGEALIDLAPLHLGTNIVKEGQLKLAAGGAPANVAVGVARLGCPAGFVGKVGQDFFGVFLKDTLQENGVDTSRMRFETRANTGLAFVSWNERHEAEYLFYRGPSADTMLEPEDLEAAYLGQAKVLQFGSLLLATEPSGSATYAAIQMASAAGLLISYDVNLRMTFWKNRENALKGVTGPLDAAHIVKLNQAELEFLTGEADPVKGTQKLWREQFKLVIVTLDKAGCFYRTAGASGFVPAFPAQVVDTVGAGDGFLAGLLARLWQDNFNFADPTLIEQACRQAAAVGAIVVGRAGAIPALPTRTEVEQFLALPH